ncbi:hypothetical protein QAD02_023956 [Eretmocerus hayati]|uniref:Uncharacterized protein n=1 Tax=Eretmocerus hayati TaxID=131215 RepID=A0ACC2PXA3_9HYME|nr:hypothetical protein QAD02_023956 [Eretmocerus hayati]
MKDPKPAVIKQDLVVELGKMKNNGIQNSLTESFLPKKDSRLDLSFSNIAYSVRKTFFSKEQKKLLSDVSGEFKSGELTAIMGPSGAGKTTLLNVLAGLITTNVKGDIKLNGKKRSLNTLQCSSAYIMQEDHLYELLTVQESMDIAAALKLRCSREIKKKRIDAVLEKMSLEKVRGTFTEDLSGGERKRLAVALELIGDSPIMFFDEVTSHLDSSKTRQCIEVLKSMASEGRNIICTIHQPSAALLEMFDHLYVVADGHCVYSGDYDKLLPLLASLGLQCPRYHNPTDFLLEIVTGEYGDHRERLTKIMENGKSKALRRSACVNATKQLEESEQLSKKRRKRCGYNYPVGTLSQIGILLWRNILRIYRDRSFVMGIFIINLVVAIMVGLTFSQVGEDATKISDNVRLLTFNMMFITICALNSTLITFPAEMPIIKREHFNRWYRLRSTYLANYISSVSVVVFSTALFTTIVYVMTGQIMELHRFALYLLNCVLIGAICHVGGLMFGVAFDVKLAVFLGQYSLTPFIMFSEIFVRVHDVHEIFGYLSNTSIFKFCYEGFMLAIYGFDRPKISCPEDFCYYSVPKVILREYDVLGADYWFSTKIMSCFFFAFHAITYFQLYTKMKE